jgi:hypothetical protein
MSFNFQDKYEVVVYHNKIQFCRKNNIRTNFRITLDNKDLDEGVIINFPYESYYNSYKGLTNSICLSSVFDRAGVIPYTVINGEKHFCLAVDSQYGNLTDFGGCVKKYETFTRAASRELYEESLGVFNYCSKNLYDYSIAVYDKGIIILFLRVDVKNIDLSVREFHRKYSAVHNSESSSIMWVPENILYMLIKTGKSYYINNYVYPSIYKPVCDLLRSVCGLNEII